MRLKIHLASAALLRKISGSHVIGLKKPCATVNYYIVNSCIICICFVNVSKRLYSSEWFVYGIILPETKKNMIVKLYVV